MTTQAPPADNRPERSGDPGGTEDHRAVVGEARAGTAGGSMSEDIVGALEQVAFERRMAQAATLYVDLARTEMLATPQGIAFTARQQELADIKELLARAEAEARAAIVAAYRETGNKKPAEGAGIRVTRKAVYDMALATAWAQVSAPALMVLDAKAFEKANLPGAPIEWEETPTATIATDLTMYEDAEVTA